MWTDAAADPPRCAGSGDAARSAETAADGYPNGRALCPRCQRFVAIENGALADHDASDASETAEEISRRREWLNTHGW